VRILGIFFFGLVVGGGFVWSLTLPVPSFLTKAWPVESEGLTLSGIESGTYQAKRQLDHLATSIMLGMTPEQATDKMERLGFEIQGDMSWADTGGYLYATRSTNLAAIEMRFEDGRLTYARGVSPGSRNDLLQALASSNNTESTSEGSRLGD